MRPSNRTVEVAPDAENRDLTVAETQAAKGPKARLRGWAGRPAERSVLKAYVSIRRPQTDNADGRDRRSP